MEQNTVNFTASPGGGVAPYSLVIAKHVADEGQLTKQGYLVFDFEDFEITENTN